jgi:hypothetical protein
LYYLSGPRACFRTLLRLVADSDGAPTSLVELRKRYIYFCAEVGGPAVRPLPNEGQVTYAESRISAIIEKYKDRSSLTDIGANVLETPMSARVEAMTRVAAVKHTLSRIDPAFSSFFDFFIHTLFYQRAYHSGGGSVSSALGVVWCAVNKQWTDNDIIEFFVHELTHNLLFLDERANKHYVSIDAIAKRDNWAISAILERPRPLDKVFHSLMVAHEVLKYREVHGEPDHSHIHPSSLHLRDAAWKTSDSIARIVKTGELVTPRFLELLDSVIQSLEKGNIHEFGQREKIA